MTNLDAMVAKAIPSNWIDPLLTGPRAVIGKPPYGCPDIERVLNALKPGFRAALIEWGQSERERALEDAAIAFDQMQDRAAGGMCMFSPDLVAIKLRALKGE